MGLDNEPAMVVMDLEAGTCQEDGSNSFKQSAGQSTDLLSSVPQHARISVEFADVDAFVPVLIASSAAAHPGDQTEEGAAPQKEAKERQILFGVSACVEPGEMLALMGPSGSGKSSLLTLLGGRSTARFQGSISFNQIPLNKAAKRKLGFVSQDDLLFAELTVYETLYFAAMLRLPRSWSYDEKVQRAEMVLSGLGLDKCRDTIIGNHMMRGVSGGERKRVSIGHELLINPSVIFLDEPTSGLDSTTALKLLHTLRILASGGRTIITSIHQPSSRLYQQMDKLLLLSEGHTLYYGDAHASAHWFGMHGCPVPFGVSTADHILDLACGDLPGRSQLESRDVLSQLLAAFKDRKIGLERHGVLAEHMGRAAMLASASSRRDRSILNATLSQREAPGSRRQPSSSSGTQQPSQLATLPSGSLLLPAAEGQAEAGGLGLAGVTDRSGTGVDSSTSGPQSTADTGAEGGVDRLNSGTPNSTVDLTDLKVQKDKGQYKQQYGGKDVELDATDPVDGDADEAEGQGKWGASWIDQVKFLTQRSLKTRRFSALSIQRIVEVLAVGILAGLFWFQSGNPRGPIESDRQATDIGGLLFFEVLFLAFSSMFQAIFNYPSEFLMLVKERQSGMYRLSAYYVARSLADLPMDCMLPSILIWIVYGMGGLRGTAEAFFANWGAVLMLVLIAQSIGLLIGATISNIKNCLTLCTVMMLSIMLVGGYYVRNIPVWISWLKYISFIYWGWNLTLMIEFGDRGIVASACSPPSDSCTVAQANLFPIDVDSTPAPEACVLVGLLVLLRIATYFSLNYKTTFKKHN